MATRSGTEQRPCAVCGGTTHAAFMPEVPLLQRCGDCGFVWREDPAEDLYGDGFFSDGAYYEAYFARSAQWRHEAERRLSWLLAHARPRRLLEVGSGGGFFVEAATRAGLEAEGIEPAPDGADYARRVLGVAVVTSTFEEAMPHGTFDTVCAFHVLEHVKDPYGFLTHAGEVLAPRGWLALEVPNIESARARRERATWEHLQPDFHLSHFSQGTLVRLVRRAGFEIQSCDTVFPHYYLRPRALLTRYGGAEVARAYLAARSTRAVDPTRGDFLRLIARRLDAQGEEVGGDST